MSFKSISQIDTNKNDSIVTLSETVSRKVISDLVRYDFAKDIIKEQEIRIKNYQDKEIEFNNQLGIKDSIIFYQKEMIDIHKEIIKNKKPFELHGYLRVQTVNASLVNPYLYGTLLLEFTRFSIGGQYFVQPNNPSGYGFILEYNLF